MASLFFCKIHEFCVRTQSGYQQFRKFYFRKSVHRSNSGHKIGFSKKEKSEIRSKNSQKMLDYFFEEQQFNGMDHVERASVIAMFRKKK